MSDENSVLGNENNVEAHDDTGITSVTDGNLSVETGEKAVQQIASSPPTSDRRRQFRRLLALAGLGITSVLLSQEKTGLLPLVHAGNGSDLVIGNNDTTTNTGTRNTELYSDVPGAGAFSVINSDTTTDNAGVYGESDSSTGHGIRGNAIATGGIGVVGTGTTGVAGTGSTGSFAIGVSGTSAANAGVGVQGTNTSTAAIGSGLPTGVSGLATSSPTGIGVLGNGGGIGVAATAVTGSVIPLLVLGNSMQSTNLQVWAKGPLTVPPTGVLGVVDANGNFGIGTSSPKAQLHVSGAATADVFCGLGPHPEYLGPGPAMNYGYSGKSLGEGSGFFNVRPDASATPPNPSLRFMTVDVQRMIITNTGKVGIGTSSPDQALSVSGNADKSSGGTAWGTFSDRRWKDPASIEPFTPGLEWVRSLPTPVRFHYTKDNGVGANPEEENVNFIAQDLLDGAHDNLVYATRSKVKASDKESVEMYGVNVNDMHFAVVNAIKELAEEVRLLKSRLDASEQTKLAAS